LDKTAEGTNAAASRKPLAPWGATLRTDLPLEHRERLARTMWAVRRLHDEPVDFDDPESIRAHIVSAFGDGFEYGAKMVVHAGVSPSVPTYAADHVRLQQGANGKLLLTLELEALESAPTYQVQPVNPAAVRSTDETAGAPAALEERHLRFLRKMQIAGCTCMTKTPDIQYHALDCKYRLAAEVEQFVSRGQSAAPATEAEFEAASRASATDAVALLADFWKWVPVQPDGVTPDPERGPGLLSQHQVQTVFTAMANSGRFAPRRNHAADNQTPAAWLWYEPASEWNGYEGRVRVSLQKPKVGPDCRDIQALVRQSAHEGT